MSTTTYIKAIIPFGSILKALIALKLSFVLLADASCLYILAELKEFIWNFFITLILLYSLFGSLSLYPQERTAAKIKVSVFSISNKEYW